MSGLWIRIQHRFGPRMPEWFMSGHFVLFGLALLYAHGLFLQPSWAGFRGFFAFTGLSSPVIRYWMGAAMLATGIARLAGLIVNGAPSMSPRIRQVSAAMGCLVWFGITYSFASTDVVSTWLAIYPVLGLASL